MRTAMLALAILCAGCTDEGAPPGPCGTGGTHVVAGAGAYCTYIVIEGGFHCPAEFPFRFDFAGGTACADHDAGDPGEVPEDVCDGFPGGCAPREDAGDVSDASADADAGPEDDATEDAPADAVDSGPIVCGDTVCAANEFCHIECLCCGVDAGLPPSEQVTCKPLPTECGGTFRCDCIDTIGICDEAHGTIETLCA